MNHSKTQDDLLGAWAYRPAKPLEGQAGRPLSGLSFSVKDLFGVAGWPLSASTQARLPGVPPSPLVTRLLDLGATLSGKTHLHEIALGISGANPLAVSRNPLDPARMPGGSSSGAAISVAAGEVDFALGTDTGGSIRVPAAWCGVVGFKPSKGKPSKGHPTWPTEGVLPLSPTCDHTGPLARDLRLLARLHQFLSGAEVTAQSWQGLKVGLWQPEGWLQASAVQALEAAQQALRALGAEVIPLDIGSGLHAACGGDHLSTYSTIVQAEAARIHAAALQDMPTGFSAPTEKLLRLGMQRPAEQLQAAYQQREAARAYLRGIFRGVDFVGVDMLLAPTVAGVAPVLGAESMSFNGQNVPLRDAVLRLTVPFSLTGLPTLALPYAVDGLSVGVQLVMDDRQDAALLGLGLTLQAASDAFHAVPLR